MDITFIYIQWFDAYYDDDPCVMKNMHDESPCILETSGLYVGDEKGYICIANERMPDGEYKYRHYIPKVNIIKKLIFKIEDVKEGQEEYLVIPKSDPPEQWVGTNWDVRENIRLHWKDKFKACRRKNENIGT